MPLIDGVNYVEVKEHANVMKKLMDAFNFCKKTDVLVGIPQENNATREDGVTNVQLMYIHTYGSPARRIPARPTIEPAITDPANRAVLQNLLKVSMVSAFAGNLNGALTGKNRAGMMAVNMIKTRFGSAALAPNAPSTVRRKGSSAPLIDTGVLRNSITFVIRKK